MYLLQTSSDNSLLVLLLALIISLAITYYLIKGAINASRATRYQEAQLKLLALMARNNNVDLKTIQNIVHLADKGIWHYDKKFKQQLEDKTMEGSTTN